MSLPLADMLELFHRRYAVDPVTGCWVWTGEIQSKGYGVISIRRGGVKYKRLAHRFSLEHVGGVIMPPGLNACHECDNRPCVNPEHLFPGTQKRNMEDCVAKGRQARGEMLPQTKLTEDQVQLIWADKRRYDDIAEEYGVPSSSIANIKTGKEWKWLTAANNNTAARVEPGDRIAGEQHYAAKLTEAKVLEIRASSESDAALARRYGMSEYAIMSARTGMTWRRVPMPPGQFHRARPGVGPVNGHISEVLPITPDLVISNDDSIATLRARVNDIAA